MTLAELEQTAINKFTRFGCE